MDHRHYSQLKSFRIYALLLRAEDNFFYIGKTTAQKLSALYNRHRTGAVKATESYFDQEEPPELYLLETCNVTGSDAYRRVVAWCHIFLQAGYAGINHDRTLYQAENLLPETKQIVQLLGREPLEEVLRRTHLEHPSDGDLKPKTFSVAKARQKTIQMNIRIDVQDKKCFDQFCKEGGMNQREGFSVLLDRIMDSADYPAMAVLLKKREEKIARLEQENSRYKASLKDRTGCGKSQKEAVQEKRLEFMRTGIQEYLQRLFPESEGKASLPETSWRKYMRNLPENEKPQYPAKEGFLMLRPEAIVWGNTLHRPCFLVGRGEDGRRYLLRCYPRADFIGFPVRASSYAKPGEFWYVGCRESKDGAMELLAAFPLCWGANKSVSDPKELPVFPEERGKLSLDKAIQEARAKRQY